MDTYNCYVMSKDRIVGRVTDGIYDTLEPALEPLFLKRTKNFNKWLRGRAIDEHRTNSRLLKRILRLADRSDEEVVLNANAVTITDTYWVKPIDSELTYDDVRFRDNIFDMVALIGDSSGFDYPKTRTPELTNIGSFEKCWQHNPDGWYMLKRGNNEELFSEVFVYELGRQLGFNMAEYFYDAEHNSVKTKDFTNGASVNLEDAEGIIKDAFDFSAAYDAFAGISRSVAADYAKMLYLDALVMNFDRHIHNFGILRSPESGEILSFAPNFDNNNSLFVNSAAKNGKISEGFITDYCDFFAEHLEEELPSLEMVKKCSDAAYEKTAAQFSNIHEWKWIPSKEATTAFVMGGAERIEESLQCAKRVRQARQNAAEKKEPSKGRVR